VSQAGESNWRRGGLDPTTFELLARELAGAELQSALLEVMRRRAQVRAPRDVLDQFRRDPFCAPALVDQRTSTAIEAELLDAAAGFEAIELSPLAPLGGTSAFALTDQNRVVSALRGTEVVSDPTNVLALQSALDLRGRPNRAVHYATSHRVVRAQPAPKRAAHSQHFRLFVLTSAGLERKNHGFKFEAVIEQVRIVLAGLERLERHGYAFGARRIEVLTTPDRSVVGERVASAAGLPASCLPLDHAYYSGGLRFKIWLTTPQGVELPVIDGGCFDWVARLTANRRAVFVATGVGEQLIPLLFRPAAAGSVQD
jgi:hypothetical protein